MVKKFFATPAISALWDVLFSRVNDDVVTSKINGLHPSTSKKLAIPKSRYIYTDERETFSDDEKDFINENETEATDEDQMEDTIDHIDETFISRADDGVETETDDLDTDEAS
ncbi:hypothetical protein JCM33374_g5126 [Metschnikowia sp. JCM 33374]|nr:hypothetical protein JCM33374_g5126 [Metschnikowia sp. JCM 33374]